MPHRVPVLDTGISNEVTECRDGERDVGPSQCCEVEQRADGIAVGQVGRAEHGDTRGNPKHADGRDLA